MMPFDQYRQEHFRSEGFDPQGVILAYDRDQLVGFSGTKVEAGVAGHTWFLGVARPYRRRVIAVASKVMTIRWALARGLSRLETNNNPASEPIIALNRQMGYAVTADRQYVRKDL